MNLITKDHCVFDFYIVNTPRHWWIAQAMVSHLCRPSVLLIFEGFKGSRALYEISLSQNNSLFAQIVLVPGKLSGQNDSWMKAKLYRKFEWTRAKTILKNIFIEYPPSRVLTANVNSVHIQYLYMLSQKHNIEAHFHVIDDGLQSYHAEARKPKKLISLLYASLKHGFKIKSAPSNRIFPFFSDGWFFDASIVQERFAHLDCHDIPKSWFESSYMRDLQNSTLMVFGLDMVSWNKPKIIFVFTKLSLLKEGCKNFDQVEFEQHIQDFVHEKGDAEHSLWVKYHPRELEVDPFHLREKYEFLRFVPVTIPFELLSSSLYSKDIVVGEQSTVLFDIAINRSDVDVYSLGCSGPESSVGELFDRAGVMRF